MLSLLLLSLIIFFLFLLPLTLLILTSTCTPLLSLHLLIHLHARILLSLCPPPPDPTGNSCVLDNDSILITKIMYKLISLLQPIQTACSLWRTEVCPVWWRPSVLPYPSSALPSMATKSSTWQTPSTTASGFTSTTPVSRNNPFTQPSRGYSAIPRMLWFFKS